MSHKLLSKLRIYENIRIKDSVVIQIVFWLLQYRTRPVGISDTSRIHRTETLNFYPWPYQTCPIGAGQNQLICCLWFNFIICCILASQQINYSTRELIKASYGKHDKSQVKLISHFHYFTNVLICEPLSTKHKVAIL